MRASERHASLPLGHGLILLEDLASGEYDRRKGEEAEAKRRRIEKRRLQKEERERATERSLQLALLQRQAEEPRDLEWQRAALLAASEAQSRRALPPPAERALRHYLSSSVSDRHLPEFPAGLYGRALRAVETQCARTLRRLTPLTYQLMLHQNETEVRRLFAAAMRHGLLAYVLEDADERERLGIPFVPSPWPAHVLRAPVPWHNSYTVAKQKTFYRYYEGNPILVELRNLWQNSYQGRLICDMSGMEFPQYPAEFSERLVTECARMRSALTDEWLVDVADTLIRMRQHWAIYVAKRKNESTFQVEQFFRSDREQEGNNYGSEYQDYVYIKNPLIRIRAVAEPETAHVLFEPTLQNMREQIVEWFQAIIAVNYKLPSVDTLLYPGSRRPQMHLLTVGADEEHLAAALGRALAAYDANRAGPPAYVAMYQPYHYILDGQAKSDLLQFFALDPPPGLKIIALEGDRTKTKIIPNQKESPKGVPVINTCSAMCCLSQ
ncbi:Dynein heavy chain 3, axonemal [Eumeta japonica]|uniref:Dynein heavy chain 3, axonemal n=1 Tax=Eumeta variegata TaxID=151549 RepID=A0A4C1Z8S0_EUMVA|nr:Dynein heavy chain 3, axonemal [Eumeta japonica]